MSDQNDIKNSQVLSWLHELTAPQLSKIESKPEPRTLVFVISEINKNIYLSLHSVCSKKKGGYAKSKAVVISLQKLLDFSLNEAKSFFTLDDWDVIYYLQKHVSHSYPTRYALNFPDSGLFLKSLIETGKCFFGDDYDQPLTWGASCHGKFEWEIFLEKKSQSLNLVLDKIGVAVRLLDPICYFNPSEHAFGNIIFTEDSQTVKTLMKAPLIPIVDSKVIGKLLSEKSPAFARIAPLKVEEITVDELPRPVLKLYASTFDRNDISDWAWGWYQRNSIKSEPYQAIVANYSFIYGDYTPDTKVSTKTPDPFHDVLVSESKEIVTIIRKSKIELDYIEALKKASFNVIKESDEFDYMFGGQDNYIDGHVGDVAFFFLEERLDYLKKAGWNVEFDSSFPIQSIHDAQDWFLDANEEIIEASHDWLDINLGVLIDGERVDLLPVLMNFVKQETKDNQDLDSDARDAETHRVLTKDGKLINFNRGRLRKIARHLLVEFSQKTDDKKLKVSKWNMGLLAEFSQGEIAAKSRWIRSDSFKILASAVKEDGVLEEVEQPSGLQCELRSYQKQGLNWLQLLSRSGLNGILADDMGLGKTVQTLAHILVEKDSGRMKNPVIVIAPTSLMPNWFNEAAKLAPSLKVLVLHGNERKNFFSKISDYDVILTTYPLLMRDKEFLIAQQFHMMILDEAQSVKNSKTQAYHVIQQINTGQRICLSGTPMENHLGELWSLFHLLLPGFLGDQKTFQAVYRKPIEKQNNTGRRIALAKRIKPFILRRTKQQVAQELPEKTEIIQRIELKSGQRDLYEAIRMRAQTKVMQEIAKKGLASSQIILLDALLKLRQVCCDPRLVKLEKEKEVNESAKLECLMQMLTQMLVENRKILIFSQFTSMLDLITQELVENKIDYTILTGKTKDRSTPVEKFQNGEVPVMLISLKAGGVGLNLTAADTVIHYDPWWNPAVENQATDRAHRIGQKNAVFVYKFIVTGSLEEKIIELQERKKGMTAAILDADANIGGQLSMQDLEDIFKPLPQPI